MLNSRENNIRCRNRDIRNEVKELASSGIQMKLALAIVAEKYYLSEATVRDVVYDKRRK